MHWHTSCLLAFFSGRCIEHIFQDTSVRARAPIVKSPETISRCVFSGLLHDHSFWFYYRPHDILCISTCEDCFQLVWFPSSLSYLRVLCCHGPGTMSQIILREGNIARCHWTSPTLGNIGKGPGDVWIRIVSPMFGARRHPALPSNLRPHGVPSVEYVKSTWSYFTGRLGPGGGVIRQSLYISPTLLISGRGTPPFASHPWHLGLRKMYWQVWGWPEMCFLALGASHVKISTSA